MQAVLFLSLLAQWTPIGPWGGPAGYLSVDVQRPDRAIACSRNGNVFLSNDAGNIWRRLPFPRVPGASIEVLKIHPKRPDLFLAGVSDETGQHAGLYSSVDEGKTWTRSKSLGNEAVFSLTFFPANSAIVAAGSRRGVFRSEDFGATWKAITAEGQDAPRPVMSMAFDPADASILYAGTTHLPWKTEDGGASWKSIHQGMLDDSDVFSIHVHAKNAQRVYASACSGIYFSDAQGEPWKKAQGIPGTDRRTHVIVSDPEYPNLLLAGTTAGLWKSADAGVNWRKLNDYVIRSLEYSPHDSRVLYMATADRGLMKSTTAGIDFREINNGFTGRPMQRLLFSADGLVALALMTDGSTGVFQSSIRGGPWKFTGSGINDAVLLQGSLYARSSKGLLRQSEKSQWIRTAFPAEADVLSIEAGGILWAGTRQGLWKSLNGTAWTPVTLPEKNAAVYEIVARGKSALLRTGKGWWLSTDSGSQWTPVSAPGTGRIFDTALHPRDVRVIFCATSTGLMKSTDRGRTWVRLTEGLPEGFFSAVSSNPDRSGYWYTAQLGRVFRSSNDGVTWKELPGGMGDILVKRLYAVGERPEALFALTDGQGIIEKRLEP